MLFPKTMKAAILVEQKKPLVIDEVQLPNTLEIGQVLVKVHYSGICGSQIGEMNGAKGFDPYLPHLLGHEASGRVVEVGPGVRYVKPGDMVVMHWRKGLGIEGDPPKYTWCGNKLNAGCVTTFNEYAIVSENRLTPIPKNSDLEVAALFGCAVTTGFGVIENNAKVRIGESVVIFGAGGVGLNIVQAAALVGAYPVIAVDIFDNRLLLAREMGATHLINARTQDAKSEIQKIAGVDGIDVFIDNTGQPHVIELGYYIVQQQGRIVLVGVPNKGDNINIHSLALHYGKVITGSHGGESKPEADTLRYLKLYDAGRIRLKNIISARYGLSDINEAIQSVVTGEATGRVLINFNGGVN